MADSLTLIQQEYDKLKGNLDNINQSIRKFNWKNNQNGFNPHGREIERNTNKSNGLIVRIQNNFFDESQSQNHSINDTFYDHEYNDNISINNDESLSEGELNESEEKPKLQSSVIQIIRPVKSREEAMVSSSDKSLVARNKRMFNYLLGTLDKFKKETDNVKEKMKIIHRKEIEEKLDEKVIQEKQDMITEKRKLFREQIDAKNKIKALEIKLEILKLEEAWEDYQKKMKVFIKTKTQPSIYYLPSTMTPEMQNRLEESIKLIEQSIVDRRSAIEEELAKLDDPAFFDKALRQIKPEPPVQQSTFPQDGPQHRDDAAQSFVTGNTKATTVVSGRQQRLANLNYVIFQFRRVVEQKIRAIEAGKIFDPRARRNDLKRHRSSSRGDRTRRRSKRSRGTGREAERKRSREREGKEGGRGGGGKDKTEGLTAEHKAQSRVDRQDKDSTANDNTTPAVSASTMADILPEDETCVNVPLNVGDITTTTAMEQSSYLETDQGTLGSLNFSTLAEQPDDDNKKKIQYGDGTVEKIDHAGTEPTPALGHKTADSDHVTNLPDGE